MEDSITILHRWFLLVCVLMPGVAFADTPAEQCSSQYLSTARDLDAIRSEYVGRPAVADGYNIPYRVYDGDEITITKVRIEECQSIRACHQYKAGLVIRLIAQKQHLEALLKSCATLGLPSLQESVGGYNAVLAEAMDVYTMCCDEWWAPDRYIPLLFKEEKAALEMQPQALANVSRPAGADLAESGGRP